MIRIVALVVVIFFSLSFICVLFLQSFVSDLAIAINYVCLRFFVSLLLFFFYSELKTKMVHTFAFDRARACYRMCVNVHWRERIRASSRNCFVAHEQGEKEQK